MVLSVNLEIRKFKDLDALSHAAAEVLADLTRASPAPGSIYSIALSGGSTPRELYRLLASDYGTKIPWPRVHLFWGDERFVPADDPRSNYGMVRENLLRSVPIPPDNIHPMPTGLQSPADAAAQYESTLKKFLPGEFPRFDLILLGLGPEGHTASLFPGSPAFEDQKSWVLPAEVPAEPPQRLTLTLPVLNNAANVWFLVAGADKAQILSEAVRSQPGIPAGMVQPRDGKLVWWVDEAAGRLLSSWGQDSR